MTHGTFHKVERTRERMFGPWKLLACGYRVSEQQPFLDFLQGLGFDSLPVVFVDEEDGNTTLKELMEKPDRSGLGKDSGLKRAVILSGFAQEDLHLILSEYRKAGFPAQLWATLTPISQDWTVGVLLEELHKESEAMKKYKNKR